MNHSQYSRNKIKNLPVFLALALLAGMIALNVFVPEPEPDADVVCAMANANISWLETYYPSAWELVE